MWWYKELPPPILRYILVLWFCLKKKGLSLLKIDTEILKDEMKYLGTCAQIKWNTGYDLKLRDGYLIVIINVFSLYMSENFCNT